MPLGTRVHTYVDRPVIVDDDVSGLGIDKAKSLVPSHPGTNIGGRWTTRLTNLPVSEI